MHLSCGMHFTHWCSTGLMVQELRRGTSARAAGVAFADPKSVVASVGAAGQGLHPRGFPRVPGPHSTDRYNCSAALPCSASYQGITESSSLSAGLPRLSRTASEPCHPAEVLPGCAVRRTAIACRSGLSATTNVTCSGNPAASKNASISAMRCGGAPWRHLQRTLLYVSSRALCWRKGEVSVAQSVRCVCEQLRSAGGPQDRGHHVGV